MSSATAVYSERDIPFFFLVSLSLCLSFSRRPGVHVSGALTGWR